MNPTTLPTVAELSNDELLARVKHLAGRERAVTAVLIAHLAELDARRLYLAEGCASLFTYCTQVLHLSEHAAYGRIAAARASRKFPVILERLSEGSVNLSTVCLLASHLTPENHREVLDAAQHETKRRVEEIVARLRPQPPVPDVIRRLPTRAPAANHATAPSTASQEAVHVPPPDGDAQTLLCPGRPSAEIAPPPAHRAVVTPLGPQSYKVQFTASAALHEKLRQAQALLRHQIPDGDLSKIFDRALTALLQDLAKQKLAATDRPRGRQGTACSSRHIPAEVRRAVWSGDGGRCAFVADNGRRLHRGGLPGVPSRRAACGGGTRHAGEHSTPVPRPQRIRGRARGRPAPSTGCEGGTCLLHARDGTPTPDAASGSHRGQLGPDRVRTHGSLH